MAVVYVLQVIAYHGGGIKGWRTVRKPSGEPYSFQTREAAAAALQQHFSNLRDGFTVRVHSMEADGLALEVPGGPDPHPNPPPSQGEGAELGEKSGKTLV